MSIRLGRHAKSITARVARHIRRRSSRTEAALTPETEDGATGRTSVGSAECSLPPKPFSEVPGPKGLPLIGSLLDIVRTVGRGHLDLKEKFDKYGPIIKVKLGGLTLVHVKDVDAIEKMHRLEGKYPRRIAIEPWTRWRKEHQKAPGVLIT